MQKQKQKNNNCAASHVKGHFHTSRRCKDFVHTAFSPFSHRFPLRDKCLVINNHSILYSASLNTRSRFTERLTSADFHLDQNGCTIDVQTRGQCGIYVYMSMWMSVLPCCVVSPSVPCMKAVCAIPLWYFFPLLKNCKLTKDLRFNQGLLLCPQYN